MCIYIFYIYIYLDQCVQVIMLVFHIELDSGTLSVCVWWGGGVLYSCLMHI